MGSTATYLAVQNLTPNNAAVSISETDDFDWDGNSRPDAEGNFNHVNIASNDTRNEREEVNSNAKSAWFRMTLVFTNDDVISFRNDQRDAVNGISPEPRPYTLEGANASSYSLRQVVDTSSNTNTFIISKIS